MNRLHVIRYEIGQTAIHLDKLTCNFCLLGKLAPRFPSETLALYKSTYLLTYLLTGIFGILNSKCCIGLAQPSHFSSTTAQLDFEAWPSPQDRSAASCPLVCGTSNLRDKLTIPDHWPCRDTFSKSPGHCIQDVDHLASSWMDCGWVQQTYDLSSTCQTTDLTHPTNN